MFFISLLLCRKFYFCVVQMHYCVYECQVIIANMAHNNTIEHMTLREYLDLSQSNQSNFGKATGFCRTTISRWLSGERMPSRKAIEKIHHATKGAVTFMDWMKSNDRP